MAKRMKPVAAWAVVWHDGRFASGWRTREKARKAGLWDGQRIARVRIVEVAPKPKGRAG